VFKRSSIIFNSAFFIFFLAGCGQANFNSSPNLLPIEQLSNSVTEKFYDTAKKELWLAEIKARQWDISSELVKVEASLIDEKGRGNWTYYFKSPFKRNAFKVQNNMGLEVSGTFMGNDFSEFEWKIDSDKAVEIAKDNHGLNKFPIISMTLEDRFASLEWELRTYNGIFRIDARTGNLRKDK